MHIQNKKLIKIKNWKIKIKNWKLEIGNENSITLSYLSNAIYKL